VIVPHGRDTDLLDPERFDRDALRRGLGLENRKVIAYIGTPRRHKGVDDLIEAVSMIRNKDAMLLFVGITDRSRELCALAEQKLGRERFLALGEQPMARIGDFLAASDIVVIPQKESFGSIGQTPAKIFDAMAMAKPVLSTAVSDIPQVLEGCGIVTEPGNVKMMADKIDFLLENKEQALTLGKKARERCIEKYSWNAMDQRLFPLFEKYAKKMNR
jgi:glycosyltransferase involved in cell wall biosynthesis